MPTISLSCASCNNIPPHSSSLGCALAREMLWHVQDHSRLQRVSSTVNIISRAPATFSGELNTVTGTASRDTLCYSRISASLRPVVTRYTFCKGLVGYSCVVTFMDHESRQLIDSDGKTCRNSPADIRHKPYSRPKPPTARQLFSYKRSYAVTKPKPILVANRPYTSSQVLNIWIYACLVELGRLHRRSGHQHGCLLDLGEFCVTQQMLSALHNEKNNECFIQRSMYHIVMVTQQPGTSLSAESAWLPDMDHSWTLPAA